jgi:hypothetical protein
VQSRGSPGSQRSVGEQAALLVRGHTGFGGQHIASRTKIQRCPRKQWRAAQDPIEGILWRKAGLLEEIGACTSKPDAAEDLNYPDATYNLGASETRAFKTVPLACSGSDLLFELVSMNHQCRGMVNIKIFSFIAGKPQKSLLGLVNPSLTYQPPR